MGVIVKRAVRVKVVVTEHFKASRIAEVRAALSRLDAHGKGLGARVEALKNAGKGGADQRRGLERLDLLLRRNDRAAQAAADELEKVSGLEIGTHYDRGVLEGFVEVDVGDDFARLVDCEIVVMDDKVVEIRDGQCPESSKRS